MSFNSTLSAAKGLRWQSSAAAMNTMLAVPPEILRRAAAQDRVTP